MVLAASSILAMLSHISPVQAGKCSICEDAAAVARAFSDRAAELGHPTREETEPVAAYSPGATRSAAGSATRTNPRGSGVALDQAAAVVLGARAVSRAVLSAAGTCASEGICDQVETPSKKLSYSACPPILGGKNAQGMDHTVAPALALVDALKVDADRCSQMACPSVDCMARANLLEAAAFAESVLSAAVGEVPIAEGVPHPADPPIETFEKDLVVEESTERHQASHMSDMFSTRSVLRSLAGISRALSHGGLEPQLTQERAQEIAEYERQLKTQRETGGNRQHWRLVSARLALAGVRDALGLLRLEGQAANSDTWKLFARRMQAAVGALVRLDIAAQRETQPAHGIGPLEPSRLLQCEAANPALTRTLFQLRRVINAAAVCSVRNGCRADEAIQKGARRAAVAIASPVLDPGLELTRILEEEVLPEPEDIEAARPVESPRPSVQIVDRAYRQGEGVRISVKGNANRCLAEGGKIVLLPFAKARSIKPFDTVSVLSEQFAHLTMPPGHEKGQGKDTNREMLFAAPRKGQYSAMVFAGEAHGGRALSGTPLRVAENYPEACIGWTGVWQTEFGHLVTIEQPDGSLSGSYRQSFSARPGFLFGKVSGRRLDGSWVSEISEGGTRLFLEGEGVFRGSWGLAPGQFNSGGRWSGICIAQRTTGGGQPR